MHTPLNSNDQILIKAASDLKEIMVILDVAEEWDKRLAGWFDRHETVIALIEQTPADSPIGLAAKAKALIAEGSDPEPRTELERLALNLADNILKIIP